jgi:hypothetical protein
MNGLRIGDLLIDFAAPHHLREEIAGDLREHFRRTEARYGRGPALKAYWKDLAGSVTPLAVSKVVTELQWQWPSSVVMGSVVAVALYLFLWLALSLHFNSTWMDWMLLSAVVVTFITAFKRPRITAIVSFVVGIFVVELIDITLTPSARHALYSSAFYLGYLRIVAVLFGVAAAAFGIRRAFKPRSH